MQTEGSNKNQAADRKTLNKRMILKTQITRIRNEGLGRMAQAGEAFDIQVCLPEFRFPEPSKRQATVIQALRGGARIPAANWLL